MIADMPQSERPRERLATRGPQALSDAELLAIILGQGTRGKSVLQLTQEMLAHFGSLHGLMDATMDELCEIKGIGKAKAIQLRASFALALRAKVPEFTWRYPLYSPEDAYRYIAPQFASAQTEQLVIILRDSRGQAYHNEVIAIGTINRVGLHPRELITLLARRRAVSFILCHNHPTGDVTPSIQDIAFTHRIEQAAETIGIPLDDHLIIGKTAFSSLYRLSKIKPRDRY
ncbi:MAG: DNA repair protein RadC [Chlamydiales bacterium]|nr:DNA repair protein RadC [Chlamydiales bacterium]